MHIRDNVATNQMLETLTTTPRWGDHQLPDRELRAYDEKDDSRMMKDMKDGAIISDRELR